jgi:mannose-6-phosphate isomerase
LNETNTLVDCPYFKTNFIQLTENIELDTTERESFTILMCVGGEALIKTAEGEVAMKRGETVLLPAITQHIELKSTGAKLLEVTI